MCVQKTVAIKALPFIDVRSEAALSARLGPRTGPGEPDGLGSWPCASTARPPRFAGTPAAAFAPGHCGRRWSRSGGPTRGTRSGPRSDRGIAPRAGTSPAPGLRRPRTSRACGSSARAPPAGSARTARRTPARRPPARRRRARPPPPCSKPRLRPRKALHPVTCPRDRRETADSRRHARPTTTRR
jgi:hypothetical protein